MFIEHNELRIELEIRFTPITRANSPGKSR
jgi:hypothetical protein